MQAVKTKSKSKAPISTPIFGDYLVLVYIQMPEKGYVFDQCVTLAKTYLTETLQVPKELVSVAVDFVNTIYLPEVKVFIASKKRACPDRCISAEQYLVKHLEPYIWSLKYNTV